ncbi:D-hexose-6-phosphate mutarotase [Sphaerotilus microaerophilus]|uniref:Putative glucose-6-phosphate 1-epimerase n=2 Tax=Sphaerotilus microaerophilus TaxID=2914710 RepID=A0ABM7YU76_9BURK|nr:D-hexose-6-phosphate mutarotase [Sphaerotilus sp. FB-5]
MPTMSSSNEQPRAFRPTGPCEFNGQPAVHLRSPGGAQATVLLHGGHVVSWIPAGAEEQLFLSPATAFGEGAAVRGGVPVIFPQFNLRGTLPVKHGFARNRAWTLDQAQVRGEHAFAVLRLEDDDATRAIWPHAFALELTVSVDAGRLDMELAVINRGDAPFECAAALHTYLGVGDVRRAQLEGLINRTYLDAVTDETREQWIDVVTVAQELDRIYWNAPDQLLLREPGRRLTIASQGFEDVVVWNPGPEKCATLPDMPADGWLGMLCVEAAQIGTPIHLHPGDEWAGMQTLILAS